MRVFITVIKLYLKVMIQYRTTFMLSLIGEPVLYLINIIYFSAIYAYNGKDTVLGYSLTQMIWYFAGISLVWQCIWNSTDNNISQKILSGDLAVDLLKPFSTLKLELAYALSARILAVMLEFVPVLAIYMLLFFPGFITIFVVIKFLIVMPLSFLMFFLLNYLIGLTAFFIKNNTSLQTVKYVLITLTAGGFIPLDFFPQWVQRVTGVLPFQNHF
jgi:ABC-2 type transport system permease protein